MTFDEVKPALRFLGIFLVCYVSLSLLYGFWIEFQGNTADFMTREVSHQVAKIISWFGYPVSTADNQQGPTVFILQGDSIILNVFEGCNGVNVMIVFLSFVVAFGGSSWRHMFIFLMAGFAVIHLTNLARLLWLYGLTFVDMQLFHYFHKYIFTAFIYLVVFALWWLWVTRWSGIKPQNHAELDR